MAGRPPLFYNYTWLPSRTPRRPLSQIFQGDMLERARHLFNTASARLQIPSAEPTILKSPDGSLTRTIEAEPLPPWAKSDVLEGSGIGPAELIHLPNNEHVLRRGNVAFSTITGGQVGVIEKPEGDPNFHGNVMFDHGDFIISPAETVAGYTPEGIVTHRRGYSVGDADRTGISPGVQESAIWDGGATAAMMNFLDLRYDTDTWHMKRDIALRESNPNPANWNFSMTPGIMRNLVKDMNVEYIAEPYLLDYGVMRYLAETGKIPFAPRSTSQFSGLGSGYSYQWDGSPEDVHYRDVTMKQAMRDHDRQGILHVYAPGSFDEGGRNPGGLRSVAFEDGKQVVSHPEELISDDPVLVDKHALVVNDQVLFKDMVEPRYMSPRVLGVMREKIAPVDSNNPPPDKNDFRSIL